MNITPGDILDKELKNEFPSLHELRLELSTAKDLQEGDFFKYPQHKHIKHVKRIFNNEISLTQFIERFKRLKFAGAHSSNAAFKLYQDGGLVIISRVLSSDKRHFSPKIWLDHFYEDRPVKIYKLFSE